MNFQSLMEINYMSDLPFNTPMPEEIAGHGNMCKCSECIAHAKNQLTEKKEVRYSKPLKRTWQDASIEEFFRSVIPDYQ